MEIPAETLLAMGCWKMMAFPGCFDGSCLGRRCSFFGLGCLKFRELVGLREADHPSSSPSSGQQLGDPSSSPSSAAYLLCDLDK